MNTNFWERVVSLSEKKDITRKELAFAIHMDVSSISKGIRENRTPSAATALEIANYLGTTIEYLLTGGS